MSESRDPVVILGYSLRRRLLDDFFTQTVSTWGAGERVLDVGGHKVGKRGRFNISAYPVHVTYLNLTAHKSPDVLGDAAALPFPAASFQRLICAELLEHVPDPRPVLAEAYRVLEAGGELLITVPFMFHIHADPYDYGRYTAQFWRENLTRLGYQDVNIHKQGLFWSVLVEMIRLWAYDRAKRGRPRPLWLRRWLAWRIQGLGAWARAREGRDGYADDPFYGSFVLGYAITARKP
jgi:SAM-dependent methyltransferase